MNENNENKMAPVDYAKTGLTLVFMGAALGLGFRVIDAGWDWLNRKINKKRNSKKN